MERKTPVILVHGFMYTSRKMEPLARYLRKRGWKVHTVDTSPAWGQVGIDELAAQLAAYVEKTFGSEQKINLVGFSMGGLTCRYYAQRMGGLERTENLVTISAPNHGSNLAWLMNRPGCVQMRPGSEFLRDLNGDIATLERARFSSIWTPLDIMILPAKSSHVSVGSERIVWSIAHPLMVLQPSALKAVAQALESSGT